MRKPTSRQQDAERVIQYIKGHETRDRPSRTFEFRQPNGNSSYFFTLTWTPGTLTIAGDLGELTLCHYQALRELESGLEWATSPDKQYLLSKAHELHRQQTLDRERTVWEIRREANEHALWSYRHMPKELRAWRKDEPKRENFASEEDYAWEYKGWEENKPKLECTQKGSALDFMRMGSERGWDVPDGWESWFKLWQEARKMSFHMPDDPNCIFQAKHRHAIMDEISEYIEDTENTPSDVASLMSHMGYEDWYGHYDYDMWAYVRVSAIQWGAAKALKWLAGEKVYTWKEPEYLSDVPRNHKLLTWDQIGVQCQRMEEDWYALPLQRVAPE